MATEANESETAITHLERAYEGNRSHPANVKGLGLAYLWAGRLDEAQVLLQEVPWICEELNTWAWWRGTQGQDDLAGYARLLAERICGRKAGRRASPPAGEAWRPDRFRHTDSRQWSAFAAYASRG